MIKVENKARNPSKIVFSDICVGDTFMWNGMLWIKLKERNVSDNVWCFNENKFGYWGYKETVDHVVDCTLTVTNYR